MPSKIFHVAIHDLHRKGENDFEFVVGKTDLKRGATVNRVVDELHRLYARRASKSHGKFSNDTDHFPTQKYLRAYLDGGSKDFKALTSSLMNTLVTQARRKPGATGGHVFFVHFEDDSKQFVMIAIVNDKLGAALTDDYDVSDAMTLDLDGFRFAGRINLTAWSNTEERYVGFLKGKGDVAEYFKEFLGCDTTVQDREDTNSLVAALKHFADSQSMVGADRDEFLAKAKAICDVSAKRREQLQLTAFSNELFPSEPDLLLSVLTDDARKINDGFIPDRRALATLVRFKAKTSFWSVEFEREAITQGKVRYNEKSNSLTLSDIPADLAEELKAQLNG
ncbi:nucleoid-associated protein [Bradyrhizobium japonicum]